MPCFSCGNGVESKQAGRGAGAGMPSPAAGQQDESKKQGPLLHRFPHSPGSICFSVPLSPSPPAPLPHAVARIALLKPEKARAILQYGCGPSRDHALSPPSTPFPPPTHAVARIALVKPEKARAVEDLIIRGAQTGQLAERVSVGVTVVGVTVMGGCDFSEC
ncbi:unnamed protein product [Closterium sp. NIES-64]|nr:unnamed protein product [Closterium sp. NIES-64]